MSDEQNAMESLVRLIAQQAWQPVIGAREQYNSQTGMMEVTQTVQTSPLLTAVASELAKQIAQDDEVREILISGLREAVRSETFVEQLKRVLPGSALRFETDGSFVRHNEIPTWVKNALIDHFKEWLGEEGADDMIERMLSQSSVKIMVDRASSEVRR